MSSIAVMPALYDRRPRVGVGRAYVAGTACQALTMRVSHVAAPRRGASSSSCVACGLCLPHCPTFRVTGEEALSPRGRIDAMRAVQWRGAPIDAEFVEFMETCVQCRGCEPACPSGVPFGHLMEGTREALAARAARSTPRWQRAAFAVLGAPPRAAGRVDGAGGRAATAPRAEARSGCRRLPLRRGRRR